MSISAFACKALASIPLQHTPHRVPSQRSLLQLEHVRSGNRTAPTANTPPTRMQAAASLLPKLLLSSLQSQALPALSGAVRSKAHLAVTNVGSSTNIRWHEGAVCTQAKESLLDQRGAVVWFTGLSGALSANIRITGCAQPLRKPATGQPGRACVGL